ncbi:hypothetical protein [Burkholderia ubonensis]|uniref:hypothetical protein n=1 Tax=Burkholderia ubonensis TaxID=101571 RepID=UPI0012F7F1B2|nr:hypothetical protein [Burkholderia ubonensis]
MKITIRIPERAIVRGRPVAQCVEQTAECEVLEVMRFSFAARAPRGAIRDSRYSYGAIVQLPDFIRLAQSAERREVFVYVSRHLNPRWRPPEFPEGDKKVNFRNRP